MNFGELLKDLRKDTGKKRVAVAQELGLSPSTLGNYENDASEPDYQTLVSLANYYNVNVDYLLGNSRIRTSWKDITSVIKAKTGTITLSQLVSIADALNAEEKDAFVFLCKMIINGHK